MADLSNGYDDEAKSFIASRSSTIGVSTGRIWAQSLPAGISILEIGCGDGIPVTSTPIEEGLNVYAMDASPKMVAAFRIGVEDAITIKSFRQLPFFQKNKSVI